MAQISTIGQPLEVGTRVHWDADTKNLYYVDVPLSQVYRYHPSTKTIRKATVGDEPLGFAFPVKGNDKKFVAALGRKFVTFIWDGESDKVSSVQTIEEVDTGSGLEKNRLNGGKVDPQGRLWAGTMGGALPDGGTEPGKGSLYCVNKGKVTKKETNIGISNGLAWDVAQKKMYYIDTLYPGIYQYDYEPDTAEIKNRKTVFKFDENGIKGQPDGLTIDSQGKLWVAVIYGSLVIRVDPETGKVIKKVEMPTSQVTAVSWGNDELNTLYVNTAKMTVDGKTPPFPAGCTFAVENLKTTGLSGDRYIEK